MNIERFRDWVANFSDGALMADGYEEAVLGIAERCGKPAVVAYDARKCIAILQERDGMEYEDACEFFQFNTLGAWAGEYTPIFIWSYPEEEDD